MIEVITATALLAVTVSGFLMMSGANAALLAKEHRMGRMNYELSSMSGAGAGEATGNTLVVEFYMENESGDGDYTAVESFDEFRVSTAPEDIVHILHVSLHFLHIVFHILHIRIYRL